MRILAVDDDEVILEILETFLETIDYQGASVAKSAAEALKLIEESDRPFDCILLDINMPEMTGIDLIPHIRKTEGYEFVPLIMLTALDDRKHITEAFVAGAWDYIVKPFEMFELEARLHGAELRNAEMARLARLPEEAPAELEMPIKLFCSMERPNEPADISTSGLVIGDAFENCLQRITSGARPSLGVLMMQIEGFERFKCELPPDTVNRYLIELARQLTDVFASREGIVSYQSDGAFMALSFVFEPGSEPGLAFAAQRAASRADDVIFPTGSRATKLAVGQVLSRDMPADTEPLYMLHAAKEKLAQVTHS